MTDAEQREAARQFANKWKGRGREDEDGRSYWIDFLSNVLGMENVTDRVEFEKKVVVDGNTKRIDVYIPETHVLIEQKSLGKALDHKIMNSGSIELTPYDQAKRYNDNLPYDEKARWIITSNFSDIWIYDMNARVPEAVKISLDEIPSKYPLLDILIKKDVQKISHEMEVSIKAGDIVGLLYEASVLSAHAVCAYAGAADCHVAGEAGRIQIPQGNVDSVDHLRRIASARAHKRSTPIRIYLS